MRLYLDSPLIFPKPTKLPLTFREPINLTHSLSSPIVTVTSSDEIALAFPALDEVLTLDIVGCKMPTAILKLRASVCRPVH